MWNNKKTPVYALVTGFILWISGVSLGIGGMISSTSVPTSGTISYPGGAWLHTNGTGLYNSANNEARLWTTVVHTGQGFHLTDSDLQNIASMGFKGIRFFVYWSLAQPTGPALNQINTAYFASGTGEPGNNVIDNLVDLCANHGLYIILCPAWTSTFGVPTWAVSQGVGGSETGTSDLLNSHNNPTIQQGVANLYAFMAARYASKWNVCFESFNELSSESSPCSAAERQRFADFNNLWISAIEANEGSNSHIKIIELIWDSSDVNYCCYSPVLSGSHANIILATHSYALVRATSSQATSLSQTWADFIHGLNYPWMDTEYSHYLGGGLSGLQQGTNALVNNGAIGWGYFLYDASSNSDNGANVNNASNKSSILAILQPYMNKTS